MVKINNLAGMNSKATKKLIDFGITTSERLLLVANTSIGRQDLAEQLDIREEHIERWVHQAELIQIKGIGGEYSHMLLNLGVDRLQALRQSNPNDLHQSIAKTNFEKQLIRRIPSREDIVRWVKQAKRIGDPADN